MLPKARAQPGSAGQDVGHLAQLQERSLGLPEPDLLGSALAGRDLALQTTQVIGRGLHLGGRASAVLCCGMCKKRALEDPDRTLATVAKLKAKTADEAR
jgi:hypothetical protein